MTMTDIGATVGVSTGELKSDQDFYENIENLIHDIEAIANSVFRYVFWYIIYNYIKYICNHIIFIIQAMANSALRYICATTIITRTRHDHQEEKGIHKGRLDKEIWSFWSLTLITVMIGDKSWERESKRIYLRVILTIKSLPWKVIHNFRAELCKILVWNFSHLWTKKGKIFEKKGKTVQI